MARWTPTLVGLALLLAACAPETADEPAEEVTAEASPAETRRAVIEVEGAPATMVLRRFETPEDFALPFTTWVPEDLRVEPEADGEHDAVRFAADFGTPQNRDGYLNVFVFEPGTTAADARGLARALKTSRGVPVSQGFEPVEANAPDVFPWAVHEEPYAYQDDGRWFVGRLAVGRHDRRFFLVVTHYPREMAEGLEPRIQRVLRDWRWADRTPLAAP